MYSKTICSNSLTAQLACWLFPCGKFCRHLYGHIRYVQKRKQTFSNINLLLYGQLNEICYRRVYPFHCLCTISSTVFISALHSISILWDIHCTYSSVIRHWQSFWVDFSFGNKKKSLGILSSEQSGLMNFFNMIIVNMEDFTGLELSWDVLAGLKHWYDVTLYIV